MADPKLKLGNDIWATKQKSLLAYNDEGGNFKSLPFQVERISGGSYVGRNGLVQYAASNEPRIDFTSNTKGALLLEPQRTNNQTYSEQFDNSAYFKYNSVSVTSNDTTAPNGTLTADKIISDGSQSLVMRSFGKGTIGSVNTFSVWAKKGNFDKLRIDLADSGGQTFTLTDEWQRVSITTTPSNDKADFEMPSASNGNFIYLWGAQIEVGSYPTSYIPTSGGAVTRVVDFTFIPSGLQNILNTSEGTLFVDVDVPRVSSTGSFERIVLSDQNASTDRIIFDNYAGNWRALMLSSAGNVNKTIVSVTANQRIKVAIAYSSTELRISYDGNAATTTTGSYTPSTTLESFKFSNKDGGSKWNGNIYDARYFNSALSNAELVELTS